MPDAALGLLQITCLLVSSRWDATSTDRTRIRLLNVLETRSFPCLNGASGSYKNIIGVNRSFKVSDNLFVILQQFPLCFNITWWPIGKGADVQGVRVLSEAVTV